MVYYKCITHNLYDILKLKYKIFNVRKEKNLKQEDKKIRKQRKIHIVCLVKKRSML